MSIEYILSIWTERNENKLYKKNTLNTIISFLSTIWKNIFIFWSSVNHGILMDIIWVPQFPSKIKHILKVKINFKVIYHFLQIHQIPSNLNVGWFSFQPNIVVYNILYTGLFLPFPPLFISSMGNSFVVLNLPRHSVCWVLTNSNWVFFK